MSELGAAPQLGLLGISFQQVTMSPQRPAPVLDRHTIILYLDRQIPVRRRIGGDEECVEARPGLLSFQPGSLGSHWRWPAPLTVAHIYVSPEHLWRIGQVVYGDDCKPLCFSRQLQVEDDALADICFGLVGEAQRPARLGAAQSVWALGERLLVHLLRHHVSFREPTEADDPVRRLAGFIREHLHEPLKLSALAARVRLSRRQFYARFQEAFGLPPMRYIREQRLLRARLLLRSTDQPISEIALETGFSDQSHLTRLFKQRFGAPPGQWRAAVGPS